jgi:hypothetical protein
METAAIISNPIPQETDLRTDSAGNIDVLTYKVVSEHLYSDLAGEAVILNLRNGKYYGLNSVGVSIWKVIQFPSTIAEIQYRLMEEFDVDADRCLSEIVSFLRKMAAEDLIETSNGNAG